MVFQGRRVEVGREVRRLTSTELFPAGGERKVARKTSTRLLQFRNRCINEVHWIKRFAAYTLSPNNCGAFMSKKTSPSLQNDFN